MALNPGRSPESDFFIYFSIAAIGSADQIALPIPDACRVTRIVTSLSNILTVADCILTFKDDGGNSMGTITVAFSGSAVGDIDTLEPSSNDELNFDSFIEVETDAGATAGGPIEGVITCRR